MRARSCRIPRHRTTSPYGAGAGTTAGSSATARRRSGRCRLPSRADRAPTGRVPSDGAEVSIPRVPKTTHKACQVVELRARSGSATVATRSAQMVAVENETGRQLHARVSFDAETGALHIVIGESGRG